MTQDYFDDLTQEVENKFIKYNTYDTANPNDTVSYSNVIEKLLKGEVIKRYDEVTCNIEKTTSVGGKLKKFFPKDTIELIFGITPELCSFGIIETIINDYITNNFILNIFGKIIVDSYKESSILYFKKYINQNYDYILNDILKYVHTWDNYSLSILFLRILISTHKTIKIQNKFIILFMKLLVNNIHLNPSMRLTIDKTNELFDNLLDSIEHKDYLEIVKQLESTA